MIKKWFSAFIILVVVFASVHASAESSILSIDISELGLAVGEKYTSLPHTGIEGSNNFGIYELTTDNNIRVTVSGDNTSGGHVFRFVLPEPIEYGTVALDIKVKKEACTSGTRNMFMFRSSQATSSLRTLTMKTDGSFRAVSEHQSVKDGKGTFPNSQSGLYGTYTTSNEYYDIRMQFSRPDKESAWSIRFYDMGVDADNPFYIQSASADVLPDLAVISNELYVGKGTSDAALTFGDVNIKYLDTVIVNTEVTDADGKAVPVIRSGEAYKAVFALDNKTTYKENVRLYAVLYNGEELAKAYTQNVELEPDSRDNTYILDIEPAELTPHHRLRLYAWRDNLSPVIRPVQMRAKLVGEVNAGAGDSMYIDIKTDTLLAADSLVPKAFVLTKDEDVLEPSEVFYYPSRRQLRLALPSDTSYGIYEVEASVLNADGNDYEIKQKTAPVYDTATETEKIGIKGVDIYEYGSTVPCTEASKDGTYTAVVRVTAHEKNGTDRRITLYKAENNTVTEVKTFKVSAFSHEEQTLSETLSLSKGSTVFAILE